MRGIVVCVHPRASEEGAKILESGGNAFDAAIATAFVQMVTLPFSCGVGGMMSAHLLAPYKDEHVIIDGCLRAGSRVSSTMWADDYLGEAEVSGSSLFEDLRSTMGYTSICTPGSVAALGDIHREFSTMPWSELVEPAIRIAKNGFLVTPEYKRALNEGKSNPYEPSTRKSVESNGAGAKLFLDANHNSPAEGELIRNPDYANTLEQIATKGPSEFYRGELASIISDDLYGNGSFVTADDLAEYKTTRYQPLSTAYGDYQVFSNSAPGAGPLLIEALNVLDGLDISSFKHGGVEYLHYIASTLKLVNQDRIDYLGDPEVIGNGSLDIILSEERASEIRSMVKNDMVGNLRSHGEGPDTTHLTVVDELGNAASITHSLGTVSGVVTPRLGFVYNNGMNRFDPRPGRASSIAPRKARLHLMMPSLAFRNGRLAIAFGAPGGNAILSALTQVFTNIVDFGMSAMEAVSAARVHAEGSNIWCEARTSTGVVKSLRRLGHGVIHEASSLSERNARAQFVVIGSDMNFDGASDPRGSMGVSDSKV